MAVEANSLGIVFACSAFVNPITPQIERVGGTGIGVQIGAVNLVVSLLRVL